jgi:hypothetical protein
VFVCSHPRIAEEAAAVVAASTQPVQQPTRILLRWLAHSRSPSAPFRRQGDNTSAWVVSIRTGVLGVAPPRDVYAKPANASSAVLVGIRPESLHDASLVPNAPADRLPRGTVELREALGAELQYPLRGCSDAGNASEIRCRHVVETPAAARAPIAAPNASHPVFDEESA